MGQKWAPPAPELRLNGRPGVRVASMRADAHLHTGLHQPLPFLLLFLILPLAAKSSGSALYQRGPGLCRGLGHSPPQNRHFRQQIGINNRVSIQLKTHLGQAELPHRI